MSKCISREGEYSEHTLIGDGEHCDYCGELDLASHDRAVKAEALREAAHMLDVAPATDTRDPLEAEVRQIKMLRARADQIEGNAK